MRMARMIMRMIKAMRVTAKSSSKNKSKNKSKTINHKSDKDYDDIENNKNNRYEKND